MHNTRLCTYPNSSTHLYGTVHMLLSEVEPRLAVHTCACVRVCVHVCVHVCVASKAVARYTQTYGRQARARLDLRTNMSVSHASAM